MQRLIALLGTLTAIALLTGAACGGSATVPVAEPEEAPSALVYTCGTTARPPIAAPTSKCTAPRGSTEVTNGHRWYSAPGNDVDEPNERPRNGKPLHGDWWDPRERADD